jgi:hypothetical protein
MRCQGVWGIACLLGALRLAGGFALALSLPLVVNVLQRSRAKRTILSRLLESPKVEGVCVNAWLLSSDCGVDVKDPCLVLDALLSCAATRSREFE